MSPTRRDTLKAAGAASGLAMLGGHAVAQQDTAEGDDDDGPGAQTLESGQGAVRVGHFVAGAPAVNVRLVPADGGSSDMDDEMGGSGTDDTDGENGTSTETETETETDAGGNTSDDNTSEDLQTGNDSNESDTGNETGGVDDDETDDPTSGGEGQLAAENVSFGDVSEYAAVEAGDYTVQLLAAEGGTGSDTGEDDDSTADEDDNGNGTADSESDDDSIISLPPNMENEYPDSENDSENGTANDSDTANVSDNESDSNTSEDLQLGDDESEDNETGNETDDGTGTTDEDGGEVIYEEDVTVGESFYTVAAVGTGADDIDLHVLRDYDAAQVRLVHASPEAPAVDVVAPDASMTLFDDVGFATATEYVGVPPGSYSLSVREAADMNDGDEVGTFDVEVESGEAYSAYAVGSPEGGEEEFDLVVTQDGQGADAGLGQEGAPGQQGDGPGASGNETDDTVGEGPPGEDDNESDSPGQSGGAGGPGADDNESSAGGPGNASGGNASGNAPGDD